MSHGLSDSLAGGDSPSAIPPSARAPVCIAGMHRSGTSMVTKLLHRCGLYLGPEEDLMEPEPDNPDGFWENTRMVELNEDLLNHLGGAWDHPVEVPGLRDEAAMASLTRKASLVLQGFREHEFWGWKDPRNSITLPFWQQLLGDLAVVLCVRNPLEVALSLHERNKVSYAFGLNLWKTYNERLLATSREEQRVVTHYDAYFHDPIAELRRVFAALGRSVDEAALVRAPSDILVHLRHNRFTTRHLVDANVSREIVDLYMRLCREAEWFDDDRTHHRAVPMAADTQQSSVNGERGGAVDIPRREQTTSNMEQPMRKQDGASVGVGDLNWTAVEAEQLRRSLSGTRSALEEREATIRDLQAALDDASSNVEGRDELVRARDAAQHELLELRQQRDAVARERDAAREEVDSLRQAVEGRADLERHAQGLEAERDAAREEVAALRRDQEARADVERQAQSLAAELDAARQEAATVGAERDAAHDEAEALRHEIDVLRRETEIHRQEAEARGDQARAAEARIECILKRERVLREMLLDARDQLLRRDEAIKAALAGTLQHEESGADDEETAVHGLVAYQQLIPRIRDVVNASVPRDATVVVISKGDEDLLHLGGRSAWHFPRLDDGAYAGYYPADSAEAIAHLEELRARGAEFLLIPSPALWWLDHYAELRQHLESRFRVVARQEDACVIYALSEPGGQSSGQVAAHAPQISTASASLASAPRRAPAACTIVSRNYLSQARILARSYLEHEPDGRFYLLVVDRLPQGVDFGADVRVVDPEELGLPGFYEMCFKYDVVEFCTAVKPTLLSLILNRYGEDELMYLDPDIWVMRPLDELKAALASASIVLTPHILRPIPLDGLMPSEQDIMISGAYNLGFIGLRRTPEANEFLSWWEERLRDHCRIDVANGLFTDQKWIDLVPSLFASTTILRDDAYNIAFWNLHERVVEQRDGRFLVNGRPAAFFHISGFNPERPRVLSKHQSRTVVEEGSGLAALLDGYARLQMENGFRTTSSWGYGYSEFDSGIRVNPLLRQIYLNMDEQERAQFGNPFRTDGPGSFLDWATRPRAGGALSPFLERLYRVRYDVSAAFPDVHGRDREAYLTWARSQGPQEMGYEPQLVRVGDEPLPSAGASAVPTVAAGSPAPASEEAAASNGTVDGAEISAADYQHLVRRIRDVASSVLPTDATVIVVSKGDKKLLDLGGRRGLHFPQTEDGMYAGYYPADDAAAIAHLEALRSRGAEFLLFPTTALWWLDYYSDLKQYLDAYFRVIWKDENCLIYHLTGERIAGVQSAARQPERGEAANGTVHAGEIADEPPATAAASVPPAVEDLATQLAVMRAAMSRVATQHTELLEQVAARLTAHDRVLEQLRQTAAAPFAAADRTAKGSRGDGRPRWPWARLGQGRPGR